MGAAGQAGSAQARRPAPPVRFRPAPVRRAATGQGRIADHVPDAGSEDSLPALGDPVRGNAIQARPPRLRGVRAASELVGLRAAYRGRRCVLLVARLDVRHAISTRRAAAACAPGCPVFVHRMDARRTVLTPRRFIYSNRVTLLSSVSCDEPHAPQLSRLGSLRRRGRVEVMESHRCSDSMDSLGRGGGGGPFRWRRRWPWPAPPR